MSGLEPGSWPRRQSPLNRPVKVCLGFGRISMVDVISPFQYNTCMTQDIAELTVVDDSPISAAEREAHLEALYLYYSGACPKGDAFTRTEGTSIGTFYTRRKEYPVLVEQIEQEARLRALSERDEEELSFEGELIAKSREIQRSAAEALGAAIPTLAIIASGGPIKVKFTDGEGNPAERDQIVHPKDIVAAAKVLQDIAAQGARAETRRIVNVIPDKEKAPALSEPEPEEDKIELPKLSPGVRFGQVTAMREDGTTITASVKRGQTINVEDIESESDE